ncbi:MAG TPA: 30S ribosome-binding factor RbfA [Candidatus Coproplasma avistercoris]|nr:30S ribosome-binding factor RbfA [Candidatus Coproplasma avistercoris]
MKGLRGERLASEFQKAVYEIISRRLRDRVGGLSAIISVTGADVAPDLKTAKIYISIFDPDESKKQFTFEAVKQNAGFIRHELAGMLRIRTVPALTFILDGSMEYGAHIDEILGRLGTEHNDDK